MREVVGGLVGIVWLQFWLWRVRCGIFGAHLLDR